MSDCGGCDDGGGGYDGGGGCDYGGGCDGFGNEGDEHHDNHYHGSDHHYYEDTSYSQSSMASDVTWGVLLLLAGGCAGGWLLTNSLQKVLTWESTSGTITDSASCSYRLLRKTSSSSSHNNRNQCYNSFAAVISYYVEGIQYTVQGDCECNSHPTIGDDVKVRYDPMDPSEAVHASFVNLWLFPMLLLFVALLGLGLLFKVCSFMSKSKQNNRETSFNTNQGAGDESDKNQFKTSDEETTTTASTNAAGIDSDKKPESLFDQMSKWYYFDNTNAKQNNNDFNKEVVPMETSLRNRNQSHTDNNKPASNSQFWFKFG